MPRNALLSTAFGAALVASLYAATPASALEPKQCLPMADMNTALKAEGQRTMIIGDREALYDPTGKIKDADILRFVNTVTSNADGSLGYQLEGDLPRAKPSTKVCVAAKLTNIRLFDARRPGTPPEALLGGKFDEALRSNEKRGTRPMVLANTFQTAPNGSRRIGLPMTILANMQNGGGYMFTRLPDGQPQAMMQIADIEYTPAGLSRLGPQVASISYSK